VVLLILALVPVGFAVSLPLTAAMIRLGHRLGAFDSAGVPGQVKAARRRIPNTGGVAIFWAIALPVLAGLGLVWAGVGPAAAQEHAAGIREQTPLGLLLVACLAGLHVLGLIDDRRPLGPWVKLAIMAVPALAIPLSGVLMPRLFPETRLLTLLDGHVGGAWLSVGVTALWFLVVTNALNFMDNMDGLAAGVAALAGACFLGGVLAAPAPQWFVGAMLALLIGGCAGFLVFNFPWGWNAARGKRQQGSGEKERGSLGGHGTAGGTPAPPTANTPAGHTPAANAPAANAPAAKASAVGMPPASPGARIFMGDAGSLVLGFLLAFLTTRTTYAVLPASGAPALAGSGSPAPHWHAIFVPLVVLAVPLYDFASVVAIRLSQGRSPFVGDTQHLSHRLVRLGLSRRAAVLVICAMTGATGVSGIVLASVEPRQAVLVAVQVGLILGTLALFEYARGREARRDGGSHEGGPSLRAGNGDAREEPLMGSDQRLPPGGAA
jgi:UDP-N-acetylmuramyl pentapeptide phosphotransferase/UDP-N-acetylglucosamine-1-phosphate transferase